MISLPRFTIHDRHKVGVPYMKKRALYLIMLGSNYPQVFHLFMGKTLMLVKTALLQFFPVK